MSTQKGYLDGDIISARVHIETERDGSKTAHGEVTVHSDSLYAMMLEDSYTRNYPVGLFILSLSMRVKILDRLMGYTFADKEKVISKTFSFDIMEVGGW